MIIISNSIQILFRLFNSVSIKMIKRYFKARDFYP